MNENNNGIPEIPRADNPQENPLQPPAMDPNQNNVVESPQVQVEPTNITPEVNSQPKVETNPVPQPEQMQNNLSPQNNNVAGSTVSYYDEPVRDYILTKTQIISFAFAIINYFVFIRRVLAIGLILILFSKSSASAYLRFGLIIIYLIGSIIWLFISGWKVCRVTKVTRIIYIIVALLFSYLLISSFYTSYRSSRTLKEKGLLNNSTSNSVETLDDNTLAIKKNEFFETTKKVINESIEQYKLNSSKDKVNMCFVTSNLEKSKDSTGECQILNIEHDTDYEAGVIILKGKRIEFSAVNDYFNLNQRIGIEVSALDEVGVNDVKNNAKYYREYFNIIQASDYESNNSYSIFYKY